jgi:hypothetical protein
MVLHRRRTRFGLETHASGGEARYYLENFQVHSEEADVVDLCLLLHVSRHLAIFYGSLKLTVRQIPRPSTLLDRLHGSLASIRWLLYRVGEHPTNIHRSAPRTLVVARNDAGGLLESKRPLDFPGIFRLLRRHRAVHLGCHARPQICSILLWRLQWHGKSNPLQLGQPYACRQLRRAWPHHLKHDDVRLLHANLGSSVYIPYCAGTKVSKRISGESNDVSWSEI